MSSVRSLKSRRRPQRKESQKQVNRNVAQIFYHNDNIEFIEKQLSRALLDVREYDSEPGEFIRYVERGMEFALRTTPAKNSTISMKDYIKKVLDRKAIDWCLEHIDVDSNIKGADTEDPRHRSKSRRRQKKSAQLDRRYQDASAYGVLPLKEERQDFDPGRKSKKLSDKAFKSRLERAEASRRRDNPPPPAVRQREDFVDFSDDDESSTDGEIDDDFIKEVNQFSKKLRGEDSEPFDLDYEHDVEDESFRHQMPNSDALPSQSRGHVVPVSKIPKHFTVNSYDRESKDSTNANDYKIKLPDSYRGISHIELISANVPKTQYIVNSSNNVIHFDEGGAELTATLTAGNYTADELATEIATQMSSAGGTYTCTNNAKTSKFTITQTAPATTFNMNFDGGTEKYGPNGNTRSIIRPNSSATLLGYGPNDQSGALTYTSLFRYDLSGPTSLLLEIKEIGGRLTGSSAIMNNVFAHLPFSASTSAINFHTHQSDTKIVKYFSPPKGKLESLSIRWTDYNGNLYDFNGHEHMLEFAVYCVEQEH